MALNVGFASSFQGGTRPNQDKRPRNVGEDPSGFQFAIAGEAPEFPFIEIPELPRVVVPVVDPLKEAGAISDFNYTQLERALSFGESSARRLTQLDFDTLSQFNWQARNLQRDAVRQENISNREEILDANAFNYPEIARANKFNQGQRLQAVDRGIPGARAAIAEGIQRGRTMSEGKFVSSFEDRAYEVAARNAAAGGTLARGFGDDSVFGKRASDLLSAEQRLQLSQVGDNTTSRFLELGANLTFDQPIKYNPVLQQPLTSRTSQDIRGVPSVSGPEIATQQQGVAANLSTLSPAQGISFKIGQNQFQAGLDQDRNKLQGSFALEASKFNASGSFQSSLEGFYADTFNAQQQASAHNLGLQQEQAEERFDEAQTTGLISTAIGTVTGAIFGGGGLSGLGSTLRGGGSPAAAGAPSVPAVVGARVVAGPASQAAAAGAQVASAGSAPAAPSIVSAGAVGGETAVPGGSGISAAYSAAAVPVGLAVTAAATGRGVYETVQGITDGSITKGDVKTALANTLGPANFAEQGINEMFGRPIARNDVNNALLLSNPVTAPLALADMVFGGLGGSGKSEQQQQRDSLREHGVGLGLFFKPDEKQQQQGLHGDSQYVRQASGALYHVGADGNAKIRNYGVNVDGKTERRTYDIDWSDPRATQSVGMLNPLALIAFGDNYQKMMGHMWNAAASDTESLSGMHENMQQYADNMKLDYNTGVQVLSSYHEQDKLSDDDYAAFMNGWNELMLTDGVRNEIRI